MIDFVYLVADLASQAINSQSFVVALVILGLVLVVTKSLGQENDLS